ncbi:DUF5343 domain-containing protein [Sinorhizobium fredii]|uniref:DUF5343 domain-containing protein n=1 Tax=Rhizobium fredii TaxID=380 RepID=UPI003510FB1B
MALPPFMNSTGLIGKIFEKIQQAKVPPRYTQDFQATVLGYGSGSAKPFIPFLKRLGFIQSDGTPTELYTRFRNADSSGAAMADAMRQGFSDLFQKNEFAHALTDDKLKNLVVEVTGKEPGDGTISAIVGSFKACKLLADFDAVDATVKGKIAPLDISKSLVRHEAKASSSTELRLAYTINVNLPETTDVNVYNAIFSAIRANLLTDE